MGTLEEVNDDYNSDEDEDFNPNDDNGDEDAEDGKDVEIDRAEAEFNANEHKRIAVRGRRRGGADPRGETSSLTTTAAAEDEERRAQEAADALLADMFASETRTSSSAKPTERTTGAAAPGSFTDAAQQASFPSSSTSTTFSSSSSGAETRQRKPATVVEIFDFAGEEIRVEREAKPSDKPPTTTDEQSNKANKRSNRGAGGLSGALEFLKKKPKMSTMEKSARDWDSFKEDAGISVDLATHNRGKDGYVEKMAFLERADYRSWERELDQKKRRGGGGGGAGSSS